MITDIDTSDEAIQAPILADILMDMYEPRKVIDLGCNNGLYLAPFLAAGVEVMGYDNNPAALAKATVPTRLQDLTKPFLDTADLTLCIETLEHIPLEESFLALQNILANSNKLIFTAAQPGAGGVGHVNCQPKEFWKKEIELRWFDYCPGETEYIVTRLRQTNNPMIMGWLLNNLMVFRRRIEYPHSFISKNENLGTIATTVTSCGRFDLLKKTLDSFFFHSQGVGVSRIIIADDSEDTYQHDLILNHFSRPGFQVHIHGKNQGQAKNLDYLYGLAMLYDVDYIFHMEDDWQFIAPGAIQKSFQIMDQDPTIGTVQLDLRPAYFRAGAIGKEHKDYFEYKPWAVSAGARTWKGWCGSPHLLRVSDIRKLGRFSAVKSEAEFDEIYGASGLRTVWAKRPYVRHIGYGRSKMGADYTWTK